VELGILKVIIFLRMQLSNANFWVCRQQGVASLLCSNLKITKEPPDVACSAGEQIVLFGVMQYLFSETTYLCRYAFYGGLP
jgi:hypothetical protein